MKLSAIAETLHGTLHGSDVEIDRVGALDVECAGAIMYIEGKKALAGVLAKKPAAVVIPRNFAADAIECPYIEVDDPKLAFIALLGIFGPKPKRSAGVQPGAHVDPAAAIGANATVMAGAAVMAGARVGDGSVIYPNCVVETDASIGANTVLYSGVVVRERCVIGADCILHSGVVIGADGYGFYEKDGKIIKIPQIGNVVIGDRVEIGANTCIDRATVGSTTVGNDTKFDNLVHIAHNCVIGERCYIVAQVGMSGTVTVGDKVIIAGQVGLADHISIASGAVIMGQSGIYNDVKKAEILFGTPARPVREQHRITSALGFLPELLKRVKKIEQDIEEMKK
ncbi:MAG TPA: UDP-3-O-(3-hydroxymyristoyl)glucosamine N-acyltransferase [Spirochaetota bacterium]|nr:UDP-3-O-(3-hydroxymyristoyl)glucosamine N-acyltransferase [Spirochaetota bacterium]HPU88747.1 UDP-3-O-(3-hydroxymyristoyl)glucosamine N-acyltransferase [Spirochaetota bacterium]